MSSAVAAMGAGNDVTDIESAIHHSVISLSRTIKEFLFKKIELSRICRVAVLLHKTGVNAESPLYGKLAESCLNSQRKDGGWADVEETMWCTTFLSIFDASSEVVNCSLKWLMEQRNDNGGWGRSARDYTRIPVTGKLLYLLPQLCSEKSIKWLENEWDRERKIEPNLTYKAAFILMAFKQNNYSPANQELIFDAIEWLTNQQNKDSGWGSWKNHPVGSDPWCTGISMLGLLQYPDKVSPKVLCNGLEWLKDKQLSNGLWPYHYIEKGSSWALYALTAGHSFLRRKT